MKLLKLTGMARWINRVRGLQRVHRTVLDARGGVMGKYTITLLIGHKPFPVGSPRFRVTTAKIKFKDQFLKGKNRLPGNCLSKEKFRTRTDVRKSVRFGQSTKF